MHGWVLERFRGIAPKNNPVFVRPGVAEIAVDCDFRAGTVRPRRKSRSIGQLTIDNNPANALAGGLAVFPDGSAWGTRSPCNQTGYGERLFVSGDTESNGDIAPPFFLRQGINEIKKQKLGVEPPSGMALSSSVTTGTGDSYSVVYALAVETSDGDESDLFGSLTVNSVYNDSVVTLSISGISANAQLSFDAGGAKVNIYATSRSASASTDYRFIGQVSFSLARSGSASFVDRGTTLRQEKKFIYSGSTMPPAGMKKILTLPGGFLVGHDGEKICFSEVGKPSVWPPDYRIKTPTGGKIIGMAVNVDQVYVSAENSPPYVITALTPNTPQVYFTQIPWPCIAGETTISAGSGVIYASKSGIVQLQGQSGSLLTGEVLDERSFTPYASAAARAINFSDGVMVIYGGSKTLLIDPQSNEGIDMTDITEEIFDAKEWSGKMLFVSDNGSLFEYEGSTEKKELLWRSGYLRVSTNRDIVLNYLRVLFDQEPISSTKVLGGIGSDWVGGRRISGSMENHNVDEEEAVVECKIYMRGDEAKFTLIEGGLRVSTNRDIPIGNLIPAIDFQVEVRTKSEVTRIVFADEANKDV